uniref:Thrombomodulin n=1 Tax=Leptobrachium leishanense TaxID=445787 RepID=A0A8C5PGP6_9ANUR
MIYWELQINEPCPGPCLVSYRAISQCYRQIIIPGSSSPSFQALPYFLSCSAQQGGLRAYKAQTFLRYDTVLCERRNREPGSLETRTSQPATSQSSVYPVPKLWLPAKEDKMLLIFQTILSVLLSVQLVNPAPAEQQSQDFFCVKKSCYVISWNSQKFQGANKVCMKQNGQLMEVRSTVEADVISILMEKANRDNSRVWIGLKLPAHQKCTDPSQTLRGFTWATGDSNTDYSKWKDNEEKCGPRCVSVNHDQTWEETDCDRKADGFLCEFSFPDSCSPITTSQWYNVSYRTPFGDSEDGITSLPPDTMAHVSIVTGPLHCKESREGKMKWTSDTPGAWSCMIENGGCEFICDGDIGPSACQCETGVLKKDGRTCSTPCDPNPCDQQCVELNQTYSCMCHEGYRLVNETKCEDVDDCKVSPGICDQVCTNTVGSFVCKCHPGFEMIDDRCEDIDECDSNVCEETCTNTLGDYVCSCSDGYVVDEKNPSKCKQFCGAQTCEAVCDPNFNKCNCPDGYLLDDTDSENHMCVDIDECEDGYCQHACANLFGSYKCTCPEGFILQDDTSCIEGDRPVLSTSPSSTRPPTPESHSIQPTMLLGICIGLLCLLIVIIAIICHMVRKHYMENHAMDYKGSHPEKEVALQQVKTLPQHKL